MILIFKRIHFCRVMNQYRFYHLSKKEIKENSSLYFLGSIAISQHVSFAKTSSFLHRTLLRRSSGVAACLSSKEVLHWLMYPFFPSHCYPVCRQRSRSFFVGDSKGDFWRGISVALESFWLGRNRSASLKWKSFELHVSTRSIWLSGDSRAKESIKFRYFWSNPENERKQSYF